MAFFEEESIDPEINPKLAIAVDVVVFSIIDNDLRILLVQRDFWPFNGDWSLPGGFASPKEKLEETAKRELSNQTGLKESYLEECGVVSSPGRDPRTRVVSVSYIAVVSSNNYEVPYLGEKVRLGWFSFRNLPKLVFDHADIVQGAYLQLRQRLKYSNIAWSLLPVEFTLTELQRVYEIISGAKLDKRNFRKKVFAMGMVTATEAREKNPAHRPAKLYRFQK